MKKRYLFSGSADFTLYDFFSGSAVNENVFAYSNRSGGEYALVLYNNSYARASGWIKDAAVANRGSGNRDSLCPALALHCEGDCFVVMRELRSSLWYIRSSKDMAEHGLYAALDGYQAQVFLDIHEVRDGGRSGWARLNHELSGRGAADLESAKMDLVLGELYCRYNELFKPGIEPAALKPLVIAFVETARAFIGGNGVYDPWVRPGVEPAAQPGETEPENAAPAEPAAEPESAVRAARRGADMPQAGPEQLWDNFTVYLERLIAVQAAFDDGVSPAESECAGFGYAYATLALLRPVIDAAASGADAASLVIHWQLDRKLREILRRLGTDEEAARRRVEILLAFLSRTGAAEKNTKSAAAASAAGIVKKQSAKDLARQLILDNYTGGDFRRILGINVFDDVTWFNKEAFEQALSWGAVCAAMETGDAALAAAVAGALRRAEKHSGYRLDALIEALSAQCSAGKNHRHGGSTQGGK
jgi:hypothetical protein